MQIDLGLMIYILSVVILILIGWVAYMHIKIKRLLAGSNAKTLEDTLVYAHSEIKNLREFEKQCLSYFTDVEKRLNRSIQAVETVRFNPFKGMGEGGNQSFSTILVNEKGEGVVLSTLNSRDRISIFSKPIAKFESPHELTEEEQAILEIARKKLNSKNSDK